ncbi:MAG: DUF3060 domain-containing protein [Xanthomonadaceae bacterium]|nr:DUF3060 domain-containing protein [Xanthomonadaceae bacterium]
MKKAYVMGIAGALLFCAGHAVAQTDLGTVGSRIQVSEDGQAGMRANDVSVDTDRRSNRTRSRDAMAGSKDAGTNTSTRNSGKRSSGTAAGRRIADTADRGSHGNASTNRPDPANNLNGNGRTMRYGCEPGDQVTLSGNDNIVRITGNCSVVRVYGGNNQVNIDAVDEILVNGTSNQVSYGRLYQARRLQSRIAGPDNLIKNNGN